MKAQTKSIEAPTSNSLRGMAGKMKAHTFDSFSRAVLSNALVAASKLAPNPDGTFTVPATIRIKPTPRHSSELEDGVLGVSVGICACYTIEIPGGKEDEETGQSTATEEACGPWVFPQ
jgi:hypothetical protein